MSSERYLATLTGKENGVSVGYGGPHPFEASDNKEAISVGLDWAKRQKLGKTVMLSIVRARDNFGIYHEEIFVPL